MQRDDVERMCGRDRRERLRGAADIRCARQEDEDVPGVVEHAPERPCDACREVRIAGCVVVVFDRHREGASLGGQDGGVAEGTRERVGLERRRHDGEAEVGTHGLLELSNHGERDVALQVALVELIQDDDPDALEERIGREEPAEHPLGHEPEARPGPPALVEAHAIADLVAERAAPLAGHERGGRACGDPPWLEDEDVPIAGEAGVEQRRRHPCRLAGPGGRAEDEAGRAPETRDGVGKEDVDRAGLPQRLHLVIPVPAT